MSRAVHVFLPVVGDQEALARAFVGDPDGWLPDARHVGPDEYELRVRALGWSRPVRVQLGSAWWAGASVWRALKWRPIAAVSDPLPVERLLPDLDAELGLHVAGVGATLMCKGAYHPPGGSLGSLADSTGLHRVATLTIEHLVADVAARLSSAALLEPDGERHPAT